MAAKRRRFLEMYQSETRIACGGDVYSQNQDETGNLYRGPSIDASYQDFCSFRPNPS
jgi:hypothetical protein